MRNILAAFVLVTFTGAIAAESSLSIGAGVNWTTISGNDSLVTTSKMRSGANLKIGVQQSISKHFSFLTGVSLESRGEENTSLKHLNPTVPQEINEKINILNAQIPVMAQVNFPFGIFCLDIFAGPELGIFLSGEKENTLIAHVPAMGESPARDDTTKTKSDFAKDMNMLEFGINFGIALEVKTGSFGSIFLSPGVYIGQTDLLQSDVIEKNTRADVNANLFGKSSAIYCTIGYKFNAKSKKGADEKNAASENGRKNSESNKYQSNPDQYDNPSSLDESSGSGNSGSESDSAP